LRFGCSEQGKRHGSGHGSESLWGGMEVVAGIELGQHLLGVFRIAGSLVEIDDGIKAAQGANPAVHGLPVGLGLRSGVMGG
jgi:hypothetical protein